ncbi:MAG: hypothetical protein AUJ23_01190 [Candidatus Magasanikbacteria bacterium CG1_02_32_51]|uniref:Methyltransferase type 12 domain-containing protein n=1 Tax=Candidatus Magasanikbacteria bacterium CG1_02_32_51 TaxID=1805238 RepID=A0A1J4UAW5_9BACT|nr:MAG: hypothetical protein AUJ23_01190 [Candidatus Magasanikbacteria bacterium CG1_02_32_51]
MNINSPITNTSNVSIIKKIPTKELIYYYKKDLNIDVTKYYSNLQEIYVCICEETGYKFYYPLDLGGDSDFYGHFRKYPWYYMPWKWEHKEAIRYVKKGMSVLEIGCAEGDFLSRVKNIKDVKATGLELSHDAAIVSRKKNIEVYEELIEVHATKNLEKYDIVVMFQVLEHISNIREFILSCLSVLKPGGFLLISVPNNDSFIKLDEKPVLNAPPHHLGLWNVRSLISFSSIFNLEIVSLLFEPMQKYHLPYFYQILYGNSIKNIFGNVVGKILNKILRSIFVFFVSFIRDYITGHTIMGVYKKKKL